MSWPTIEDFITADLRGRPRKQSTREQYARNLTRFFDAAGTKTEEKALALTKRQAFRARDKLLESLKSGTVRGIIATTRSYYETLVAYEEVDINPLASKHLAPPASEVPMWNVLKPGEEKRLLAGIRGKNKIRDRAILIGLLHHGWRVSEMCGLVWDSLENRNGRVGFRYETKGTTASGENRQAWQPAEPEFIKAAERWSPRCNGWPVIPKKRHDKTPLSRKNVYDIVAKWSQRILGHKVTPHGLRATKITEIGERYGPGVAQAFVGHSSPQTTRRYLRSEVEIRGLPANLLRGDEDE